jgi:hydrogenase maturation protease
MNPAKRIRVIGVGSPNGDDMVGWAAIEALRKRPAVPGCDMECIAGGYDLLQFMEGSDLLLVIDAVKSEGRPGTIYQWIWPDDRFTLSRAQSTHSFSVLEALDLASALNILPSRIIVFGIEILDSVPGSAISPTIGERVPYLADHVEACLRQHGTGSGANCPKTVTPTTEKAPTKL